MSLLTLRADIATALAEIIPGEIVVYDHPAETVALPAVVIVPADPWWEPRHIGSTPNTGVRVHLELQVIVPRAAEVSSAFGMIEELMVDVGEAAATIGMLWEGGASRPEPGKVGDVDALLVTMSYAVTV